MAEEPKQDASTDLTIQDLSSLRQIIDIACQRGAFKPGEMEQVGSTYNRLNAFLEDIARQQKAAQEAQEAQKGEEVPEVTQEAPQGE